MAKYDTDPTSFTSYGLSCVRWLPSPMQRPDHHNEIQLNILRRGRVTYLLGGQVLKVKRGHLTVFWAAMPHQIVDYDNDTDYFVATLPLAWFLQCQLPASVVQPLMRGEVVTETETARGDFDLALFAQWANDLQQQSAPLREIVTREMETRLRRLGVTQPTERTTPARATSKPPVAGLNKVEKMVCYLAQNYTQPLTVTDIGKAVGLHPNYAMGLFKRGFGMTIIDHITHHRIFHAKRLLATTDLKIVDVAYSSGFSSLSRFNEVFRRACGCTPRDFRRDHEIR